MSRGRLRVGVIGAGSWAATNHIPVLAAREEVELVVACRKGRDELAWLGERFGFPHLTEDPVEAISHGLDAVVVASPASLHFEHARLALESGAHVLCEKPFTIAAADAWSLVELAERERRHLLIAFGWNYNPMVVRAQELMQDPGIGTPEHILVAMGSGTRELLRTTQGVAHSSSEGAALGLAPDPRTWTDAALSGGGYAQAQLPHGLAIALGLTGDRGRDVFAMMSAAGGPVDVHGALAVRMRSGATASISGGSGPSDGLIDASDPTPRHQMQVRVFGSEGQLVLDLERDLVWLHRGGEGSIRVPIDPPGGLYSCEGPPDALVDLALGRDRINRSPGELGARTVEIIEAAYRSAATGDVAVIADAHDTPPDPRR